MHVDSDTATEPSGHLLVPLLVTKPPSSNTSADVPTNPRTLAKLVKHKANVNIPYLANKNGTPLHLNTTITRAQYDKLIDDLVERTIPPCETCLKDAGISKGDINEVLLVGGMTRTPKVINAVEKKVIQHRQSV